MFKRQCAKHHVLCVGVWASTWLRCFSGAACYRCHMAWIEVNTLPDRLPASINPGAIAAIAESRGGCTVFLIGGGS